MQNQSGVSRVSWHISIVGDKDAIQSCSISMWRTDHLFTTKILANRDPQGTSTLRRTIDLQTEGEMVSHNVSSSLLRIGLTKGTDLDDETLINIEPPLHVCREVSR